MSNSASDAGSSEASDFVLDSSVSRAKRRVYRRARRAGEALAPSGVPGGLSTLEARKIRNRRSAELSRKRKADYLESVEKRAKHLSEENEALAARVHLLEHQGGQADLLLRIRQLEDENARLRECTRKSVDGSCSPTKAIQEGDHIFESAALATPYFIFSPQLEIFQAPLLQFLCQSPSPRAPTPSLKTSPLITHSLTTTSQQTTACSLTPSLVPMISLLRHSLMMVMTVSLLSQLLPPASSSPEPHTLSTVMEYKRTCVPCPVLGRYHEDAPHEKKITHPVVS